MSEDAAQDDSGTVVVNDPTAAAERIVGKSAGLCPKCRNDRIWVPNGTGRPKARCKKCMSDYNASLYKATADEQRARAAKRYKENPEKSREYSKKWREAHPEKVVEYHQKDYVLNKESLRAAKARYRITLNGRARELFDNARVRARKYQLPFSITLEWVVVALERGVCERTLILFVFDEKGRHPFSPSLDQNLPEKGYTPENTRVVCSMYNIAKNEHTEMDVIIMARALLEANGYVVIEPNPMKISEE